MAAAFGGDGMGKRLISFSKAADRVFNLIYPPKCVFCGELLPPEAIPEGICPDCGASLPRTDEKTVLQPGAFFAFCLSPLFYQGRAAESIRRYKFSGRSCYHRVYGAILRDCLSRYLAEPPDLVTWAPLSTLRHWRRGYDQARLLAEEAAALYGQKPVRLLRKRRHTRPQSSLTGRERWGNVESAYRIAGHGESAGKRVLLVDDVTTTGATLSACAAVLLEAGAAEVVCLTLARSRLDRNGVESPR